MMSMKLIIDDDGQRIVRYGVRDFQVDSNGVIHVYYPTSAQESHGAPESESLSGRLVAGEDGESFTANPDYRAEDLDIESHEADDVADYRVDRI